MKALRRAILIRRMAWALPVILSFLFAKQDTVSAGISAGSFEASLAGGGVFLDRKIDDSGAAFARLNLGIDISHHFGLELSLLNSMDSISSVPKATFYTLDSIYHFMTDSRTIPYLVFGAGAGNFNTGSLSNENRFAINGGVGMKYLLDRETGIRIDIRDYMTINETTHNYTVSIGFFLAIDSLPSSSVETPAKGEGPEQREAPPPARRTREERPPVLQQREAAREQSVQAEGKGTEYQQAAVPLQPGPGGIEEIGKEAETVSPLPAMEAEAEKGTVSPPATAATPAPAIPSPAEEEVKGVSPEEPLKTPVKAGTGAEVPVSAAETEIRGEAVGTAGTEEAEAPAAGTEEMMERAEEGPAAAGPQEEKITTGEAVTESGGTAGVIPAVPPAVVVPPAATPSVGERRGDVSPEAVREKKEMSAEAAAKGETVQTREPAAPVTEPTAETEEMEKPEDIRTHKVPKKLSENRIMVLHKGVQLMIHFPEGSAELNSESYNLLLELLSYSRKKDIREVRIVTYSYDSGSAEKDRRLDRNRSLRIRRFMLEHSTIPETKIVFLRQDVEARRQFQKIARSRKGPRNRSYIEITFR